MLDIGDRRWLIADPQCSLPEFIHTFYDRPLSRNRDIACGHRPPLQKRDEIQVAKEN
jgi:hypothetical protein